MPLPDCARKCAEAVKWFSYGRGCASPRTISPIPQSCIPISSVQSSVAENKKKAERIKASWDARKAALAAGKALRPNRLPCWLEWDDQNDKPVVSALKTNTVRRMFDLACLGD